MASWTLPTLALGLALLAPSQAIAGIFDPPPAEAGMEAYEEGRYEDAISHFTEALLTSPSDPVLNYDLGAALYKGGRFEEAQAAFEEANRRTTDPALKERSLYNLGNTLYNQGKLEESITSFEEALKLDPEDEDAKRNLEYVRQELRRRMEDMEDQQQERQEQEEGSQEQEQDSPSESGDGGEPQENGQDGEPTPGPSEEGDATPSPGGEEGGQEQEAGDRGPQDEGSPTPGPQPKGSEGDDAPEEGDATLEGAQSDDEGGEETPAPIPLEGQMSQQEAERLLEQMEEDGRELQRKEMKARSPKTGRGVYDW